METATKVKIAAGSIVILVSATIGIVASAIHKIEEGNVGVYFKYGAMLNEVTQPGIHYMAPFVTSVHEIQVRPRTDTLPPMGSITRDGIQNTFNDVQVISRVEVSKVAFMVKKFGLQFREALVYDRVKEEIRIFCANNTIDDVYNVKFLDMVEEVRKNVVKSINRLGDDGLEILNLVIPKPDIPNDIARNYMQVKVQWTEQLVATQEQKTEQIKKETELMRAIADAERKKAVLEIHIKERILEKEGEKNISSLNNAIHKEKEENIANIEKFKAEKEAEGNRLLLTPEFLQLEVAKALLNNTKLYFSGPDSVVGGLLDKVFKNGPGSG